MFRLRILGGGNHYVELFSYFLIYFENFFFSENMPFDPMHKATALVENVPT